MVSSCCAYGCTERANKTSSVTFHRFPKDEEKRKIWETKLRRENFKATNYSVVCSKHFTPDCFDREKFGGTWLKKTAVPTLFDFPKHLIERKVIRKPLIKKIPEEVNVATPEKVSRKRKHYLGDFNDDDMNSPTKARKLLSVAQNESKSLRKKIKKINEINKRLEKKVFTLKEMIVQLKKKRLVSQPAVNILETTFDGPALEILLRASKKKRKGKYPPELRSFALTLHFYSKKAYMYVKKVFDTCLPSLSAIKRWYQVVHGSPGITKEALEVLKYKAEDATQKGKQIVCGLIVDEMSIRRHIELDNGKLTGYVDYGADIDTEELPVAKEALTFMVNAINGDWKIPVAYFLIDGLDASERANLIKMTLECLYETGIKVVALTFDGLPCNIKVGRELGANLDASTLKTSFPHPKTNEDVFILIDACHCLKLVRNILASKGSMFDGKKEIVDWNYIIKLESFQQDQGLMAGTKIRNRHIQWYNEKMKVKLAAQTLSKSVAHALSCLSNDMQNKKIRGAFKGCDATVRFINIFNDLFDSLNSRNLLSRGFKSPIKMGNAKQFYEFFHECENYIRGLTVSRDGIHLIDSKWKTGFLGFVICIKSVEGLFRRLVEPVDSPMSFLMTYKLSQDHLETFFSLIRSRGGYNNNPSAKQFKAAYKQLLVRHEIASSENANCLPLSEIPILSVSGQSRSNFINRINHDTHRHLSNDLEVIDNFQEATYDTDYAADNPPKIINEYVEDVVGYISGFVQRKLLASIKCEECTAAIVSNCSSQSFHLINRKNRGGLLQPNKDIYKLCKIGERSFRTIQAAGKVTSKNVIELLIQHSMGDIDSNVFSVLQEHILNQNIFDNHHIILIKSVLFEYFKIRLCHVAKSLTASLQSNKVRSKNSRLTIFKGH